MRVSARSWFPPSGAAGPTVGDDQGHPQGSIAAQPSPITRGQSGNKIGNLTQ
jgi:hypothetical protein